MSLDVLVTAGAERDLSAIHERIARTDGPAAADRVLDQLLDACDRLAEFPDRGSYPKELLALGIREYRQVFFEPYRLIHRLVGQKVFITIVADGRRDMQSLLARRLLSD